MLAALLEPTLFRGKKAAFPKLTKARLTVSASASRRSQSLHTPSEKKSLELATSSSVLASKVHRGSDKAIDTSLLSLYVSVLELKQANHALKLQYLK